VLICCDGLAGACKYWANDVAICCVEMLRWFGRGLQILGQQFCVEMLRWFGRGLLILGQQHIERTGCSSYLSRVKKTDFPGRVVGQWRVYTTERTAYKGSTDSILVRLIIFWICCPLNVKQRPRT